MKTALYVNTTVFYGELRLFASSRFFQTFIRFIRLFIHDRSKLMIILYYEQQAIYRRTMIKLT